MNRSKKDISITVPKKRTEKETKPGRERRNKNFFRVPKKETERKTPQHSSCG